MTAIHFLSGYEKAGLPGAQNSGAGNSESGQQTETESRQGLALASSHPPARPPANQPGLAAIPGQELTCPVSLLFEKDLPYSLLLGFLGTTRGVREGSDSTLTLHLPAEPHLPRASVTWVGSAGCSNPSSSDFLEWGGIISPRVRILSLAHHWPRPGWPAGSLEAGECPPIAPWPVPGILLDRLPEPHKGPQTEFWARLCLCPGPAAG